MGMPQQDLDDPDIGAILQQVSCKGVPQRMDGDAL
jgi:hypothetical protein